MRIDNRTNYRTLDLRRILMACCREDGFKVPQGALVRVVYSRNRGRVSGWASSGAKNIHDDRKGSHPCAMVMRLPRSNYSVEHIIAVIRHEVGHWRGLKHSQMSGSLLRTYDFRLADHPWAQNLPLGVQEAPKAPTMDDRVAAREAHVRAMLARHEAKLRRQKALVVRWREKAKYYDRKAAKAATRDPS